MPRARWAWRRACSARAKRAYAQTVADDYAALRADYASRQRDKSYLTIEAARANGFKSDWNAVPITKPSFLGTKVLEDYDLAELARYIDWTPFFHTWELKGRYPRILDDENLGEAATKLFDDAQAMLAEIIDEQAAHGPRRAGLLAGQYRRTTTPSKSTPTTRAQPVATEFFTLRQQGEKGPGHPQPGLLRLPGPQGIGPRRLPGRLRRDGRHRHRKAD